MNSTVGSGIAMWLPLEASTNDASGANIQNILLGAAESTVHPIVSDTRTISGRADGPYYDGYGQSVICHLPSDTDGSAENKDPLAFAPQPLHPVCSIPKPTRATVPPFTQASSLSILCLTTAVPPLHIGHHRQK